MSFQFPVSSQRDIWKLETGNPSGRENSTDIYLV